MDFILANLNLLVGNTNVQAKANRPHLAFKSIDMGDEYCSKLREVASRSS